MDLFLEIKKKFPLINFFNEKLEDWNEVTDKSENYKIDVIPELVKYRHQYLNENFVTQNLSMIFYDEKKTPIGIVPFSLTQKKQWFTTFAFKRILTVLGFPPDWRITHFSTTAALPQKRTVCSLTPSFSVLNGTLGSVCE